MKMRLSFIGVVLVVIACANQEKKVEAAPGSSWDVVVSGSVRYPLVGPIQILELRQDGNGYKDTVMLASNKTYKKKIRVTEPGYYRITFYNTQTVDFIIHKTNLTINVDGNDPGGAVEIKGSPDLDLLQEVQMGIRSFRESPRIIKLEQDFQAVAQSRDEKRIAEMQDLYMELSNKHTDSIVNGLKSKPLTLGMINLLMGSTFQDKDRYFDLYNTMAQKADKDLPNSIYAREFKNLVQRMEATAIGRVAPEISLPDPQGKVISLSSLRGKYILIDFWAKWCGPCRRENPNVVKAYKKFHDQGFDILGVSLDRSKEDWVKAIAEDGLTWNHVSDLKYFESAAAHDYNINAIPFSILVDPDGVIIAKNLRAGALEKKLAEVLAKRPVKKS